MTFPGHEIFEQFKADLESRFASHKSEVATILDKHHSENRVRLQLLSEQSAANGVKLDRLYGSEGQPGAIDRLTDKVEMLGNKFMYASGGVAVAVVLVGWWIVASHR